MFSCYSLAGSGQVLVFRTSGVGVFASSPVVIEFPLLLTMLVCMLQKN